MSSPHYIIVPRPKPPVRRQQVPAGDGVSILLVCTMVIGVVLFRPGQKKKQVATPVPDDLLLRVNPSPTADPFRYRTVSAEIS